MSNRFVIAGLLAVGTKPMAAAALLVGAAPALAVPADFAAKADAYVKWAWPANGPGAAVIVTERGKTVYAGAQGLADLDAKTTITPGTVFRLASVTKTFAAVTLLQLVDEGKISLDDPVSKYVPELPQPGASATIRQILNHTSGVKSYSQIASWMKANMVNPQTTESLIAAFKDVPVVSKPGEKWAYNNSGYMLVGTVIERVAGKPWYQVVEERISKPLGIGVRYGVGEESIPGMAKGYKASPQGPKASDKVHLSVSHAAGSLVGSPEDLAKFANALHHGKLLKPATYKQMILPTKMPDGSVEPYGLGVWLPKVRGSSAIQVSGSMEGFHADGFYNAEKDIYVIVMVNNQASPTQPQIAGRRLLALALGKPYADYLSRIDFNTPYQEVKVDPGSLQSIVGVYRSKDGKSERQFFAGGDGRLYVKADGVQERVYAAGGDRFHYGPFSLTWFGVKRDASGAAVMDVHPQEATKAQLLVRSGSVPQ